MIDVSTTIHMLVNLILNLNYICECILIWYVSSMKDNGMNARYYLSRYCRII
jgi:hypothetical protein